MKFIVGSLLVIILIGSLIGCAEAERLAEDIYVSDLYANNIGSATDKVQAGHFHDLYVDSETLYIGGVEFGGWPNQAGHGGEYLTTDGILVSWAVVVAGAHAASHTDGTDDIQDATAAQKGLMTLIYAAKLDGIEALADVTDSVNVNTAGATMNTDFNAKGDLLTATANDTPVILTIGADTFVLTADSGEASGMKWVAAGEGAGLSYTERSGADQTTAAGQGGGDGAWVDWDVTAFTSATASVVEIRIEKLVVSDSVGVRKNGSGLAREFTCLKAQSVILLVECDAGQVIEIQSNDVSDADTFSVMGYWD